jgi:predicted amidohydrolase
MKVTLGLIQMSMAADAAENRKRALDGIREAAQKGAKIICLPELFTAPYFPQDEKADAEAYAETIPGETTVQLSKAAKENKVVMIAGSIYERQGKKFYNTAAVFDETGKMLGAYRKMHIPHDPLFYEQNYFAPGDSGYKVFATRYGKIAALICYDQWFPEAARIVSLMGADIIFYPTAIGLVDGVEQSEGSWQDAWETVQRGQAIANGVVVAAVNRAGREKSMSFWGGSFVSSQFGTVLKRGGERAEIITAEVDLSLGRDVKEGWGFFRNRRPDTYAKLAEKR